MENIYLYTSLDILQHSDISCNCVISSQSNWQVCVSEFSEWEENTDSSHNNNNKKLISSDGQEPNFFEEEKNTVSYFVNICLCE